MEIDDLKAAWADLDRRLVATQTAVVRLRAEQAKSTLRPLLWKLGWEFVEGAVAVVLLSVYLANNWSETRFALPGLLLHTLAILSVAATVWQMTLARRIDYTSPVLTIQKQLARLQVARCRAWFWVFLLSPLLWILVVIVGIRGMLGGDVYTACGMPFVLANVAFGIIAGISGWVIAKVWATKSPKSVWREWLADGLAGKSLARAKQHIREAIAFAAE